MQDNSMPIKEQIMKVIEEKGSLGMMDIVHTLKLAHNERKPYIQAVNKMIDNNELRLTPGYMGVGGFIHII